MKKNKKILLLAILVISGIHFESLQAQQAQAVSQKLSPGEADAKANAELRNWTGRLLLTLLCRCQYMKIL